MEHLTIAALLERPATAPEELLQLLDAARDLGELGHRMLIGTRPTGDTPARSAAVGARHLPLPLRGSFDLVSASRLARLTRNRQVDLVHAYDGASHAVALAARALGGRFSLVADRARVFPPAGLDLLTARSLRSDRLVASCQAVASVLVAARVPAARVAVVLPGIDCERLEAAAAGAAAVRREHGIPATSPLLAHVGMHAWQGWKETLQALPRLHAVRPDAHLLLAGCASRWQRSGAIRAAAEMGLAARVHVEVGFARLPALLAACDIVVDASWAGSGFPLPLAQAMALGKPVVASAFAGALELIDADTGILVPPRDISTLAAAIDRLLAEPALAERLAAAGRARVRATLSAQMRAIRLEALYRNVLAEHAVRG